MRLFIENSKKLTFLDYLSRISNPRKPYNQLHVFLDIVAIAILAILCSADTWNEIESWGITFKDCLSSCLTLKNGIPFHDAFNRIFLMINPKEFHHIFLEWIQGIVSEIKGFVSIDGTTVRHSCDKKNGKKAIHVISA